MPVHLLRSDRRTLAISVYPDLRGFRFWWLDHTFPFGRYEVEARAETGRRYRATFEVREDLADPTRIDVPALR